jgi:uncharacterized membrane protein
MHSRWTDVDVERVMARLLRTGVLLASLVVFVGCVLYLGQYGRLPAHLHAFRGEPVELRSLHAVVRDALALDSRGIIQLGLLLLVATPVARVAFSLYVFARQHDRLYVGVTLIVLVLLTYSLIWGQV